MAKEPSQFEMKKQFNLPENAVFLGWVIHHPENDEYVVTYTSNEYMANIGWGLSPEKAKKFKTLKKANSVISDLEIGDKSEAAPAFDLGKTIVVLADRPKNGPSVNPLRTVFD